MDSVGVIFSVYAVGFTIHAARNNWGSKQSEAVNRENQDEEQGLNSQRQSDSNHMKLNLHERILSQKEGITKKSDLVG